MGAFSSEKTFVLSQGMNKVAIDLDKHFSEKGFEVISEQTANGGYHISLSNGGIFKSVLGLKTSLNVKLIPYGENLDVSAKVGIFGQQILPAAISWFVAWPVLVTQIWGLVRQSNLDDEVMACIEKTLTNSGVHQGINEQSDMGENVKKENQVYCTECGFQLGEGFQFCPKCGFKRN